MLSLKIVLEGYKLKTNLMKKLLFTLLLIGGIYIAQAQKCKCNESNQTVTINPFGKNEIPKCLRHGKSVTFKIINVNTFKVNGTLIKDTLNFNFEIPSLITNSLQGSNQEINLSPDEIEKIEASVVASFDLNNKHLKKSQKKELKKIAIAEAIKARNQELKNIRNEFLEELKKFTNTYQRIQLYAQLQDRLNEKLEDNVFIKDTNAFIKNSTAYFTTYFETEDSGLAKGFIHQKIQLLTNYYTSLKERYEKLNLAIGNEKSLTGTLIFGDKKTQKVTLKPINKKKIFQDEFEFAKKTIDTLLKPENKGNLEKKVANGINLYEAIQNADFIEYIDGGQAENDVFSSTPTLNDSNGKELYKFEPIKISTRGGVKVNFSSGYLVSFRGDDSYSSFRINDGEITAIREDNRDDLTHALGALVHVYPRGYKDIQPAFSAGISLEDDADIGFYVGGSLLFTESNRFVFTAGLSFTRIDQLNTTNLSEIQEDGSRTFLSEENTNIVLDNVFRGAFFVGITFNLSNNNSN